MIKPAQVLKYAYAVESISEHPLSDAICNYAQDKGFDNNYKTSEFEVIGGKGLTAVVDNRHVLLGNNKLMNEFNVSSMCEDNVINNLTSKGNTVMLMAIDGVLAGIFAARDTLKSDAKSVIAQLHNMGKQTILLTGDNITVAEAMADELGIDKCIAEVLPGDKADNITKLMSQGSKVAMVGDGINDSVALTVADVGMSVGSGTEVALEAADIVIMKDRLQDIVKAIHISHLTIKNIKQNLFYAFVYNTLLIPVAAGVLTCINVTFNPMIAATAMALSSVSVVLNALRLKKIKITKE